MASLRLGRAFRTLAFAAACLGSVRTPAALASCVVPSAPHACCAGQDAAEPGGCPYEGRMPCCQLTKPSPSSPSLLTAASASPALAAAAHAPAEVPPAPERASLASPRAVARSSPAFQILRI